MQQNYPNPFNPMTVIKYQLPKYVFVTLVVYDGLGREVEVMYAGKQSPGYYEATFDGSALSSGIYFYKISAGDYMETKKMLMIK
jgi:hypothetical protein